MIKLISKTEKITEKLKREGKVKTIEWTIEQCDEWNKQMEQIKRESRYKQAMSEIEASKCIFNA